MRKNKPNERNHNEIYTPELAQKICDVIATSDKGISVLCEEIDFFPTKQCIYKWIWKNKEFRDMYIEAKRAQTEMMMDEIIADSKVQSFIDEHGIERKDSGMVAAKRLELDTKKFVAIKLAPKIYGERTHNETKITITHEDALKSLE